MLYIPALRKTFIRRDVKFEEGRALSKSVECEQATMQEEEQQVPRQEAQLTPQITSLYMLMGRLSNIRARGHAVGGESKAHSSCDSQHREKESEMCILANLRSARASWCS